MAETKLSFIDTLEDLVALNEKLCQLSEFAVDLEVWSYIEVLATQSMSGQSNVICSNSNRHVVSL